MMNKHKRLNTQLIQELILASHLQDDFAELEDAKNLINRFEDFTNDLSSLMSIDHEYRIGSGSISVAIIGDFNAGKSSLINSLVGESICPVHENPTTSSITYFTWGVEKRFFLLSEHQKSEKEISYEEYEHKVQHQDNSSTTKTYQFKVEYPYDILRDITIIDTPGFGNTENANDTILTKHHASQADVILYVFDISKGEIGNDSLNILRDIKKKSEKNTPCYLVLNKADTKPPSARKNIADIISEKTKDIFNETFCYSSKWASELNHKSQQYWLNSIKTDFQHAGEGDLLNFKLTRGEKGAIVIENQLSLHKYLLKHGGADHIINSSEMQEKFRKISLLKTDLLGTELKRHYENVKEKGNHLINESDSFLNKIISNDHKGENNLMYEKIEKLLYEEFVIWAEQVDSYIVNEFMTSTHVSVRNLTNDEASHIFSPYAGLVIDNTNKLSINIKNRLIPFKHEIKTVLNSENIYNNDFFIEIFGNVDQEFESHFHIAMRECLSNYNDLSHDNATNWPDFPEEGLPKKILLFLYEDLSSVNPECKRIYANVLSEVIIQNIYKCLNYFLLQYSNRFLGNKSSFSEHIVKKSKDIRSKLTKMKALHENLS